MTILPLSTPVVVDDIGQLAERRLRESPYYFLRALRCHYRDGVLTVRGQVPNPQLRKFAEAIVSRIAGVEEVVNRVEVVDPMSWATDVPAARTAG
jgi:osmotically-inducible protein OsmY